MSNTYIGRGGCHDNSCWAGCEALGGDEWCWTTKAARGTFNMFRVNRIVIVIRIGIVLEDVPYSNTSFDFFNKISKAQLSNFLPIIRQMCF